jgi:hypothetical protein
MHLNTAGKGTYLLERQGVFVLELLAGDDEALLAWRDTPILDLGPELLIMLNDSTSNVIVLPVRSLQRSACHHENGNE